MADELAAGVPAAPGPAPDPAPGPSSTDLQIIRRCLGALAFLGTGSLIGVAFSLYLVSHYPLLLIALSPLGRHLVLVAPRVDPFALIAVASVRRLLFYLPCFFVGRALGPSAVTWIEARSPAMARWVRWLERLFARAGHAVVVGLPSPTTSALAGSSGMAPSVYIPLVSVGLLLRLVILIGVAEWLRAPIELLLALIDEYWIPGTIVLLTGTALYRWKRPGGILSAD